MLERRKAKIAEAEKKGQPVRASKAKKLKAQKISEEKAAEKAAASAAQVRADEQRQDEQRQEMEAQLEAEQAERMRMAEAERIAREVGGSTACRCLPLPAAACSSFLPRSSFRFDMCLSHVQTAPPH